MYDEAANITAMLDRIAAAVPGASVLGSAGAEHAELVALRVSKDDPRLLGLTNVRPRGAKREKSSDLRISVVGSEVEVKPVLRLLALRNRNEQEAGKAIHSWPDLELFRVVVDHDPPERLSPPPPQCERVECVDDRLLPLQAHDADRRTRFRVALGWQPKTQEPSFARCARVRLAVTRSYESWIMSSISTSPTEPSRVTVFQCRLFKW